MKRYGTIAALLLGSTLVLGACGQSAPAATDPTAAPATTTPASTATSGADLSGIKTYLLEKTEGLTTATTTLQAASDDYYALARGANFDYAALWTGKPDETKAAIEAARTAWKTASPLYEQMEGVVAGVPDLSQFDVDLDAGGSAADGGDNVVSFDITLPDGNVLAKPGNLFGVTESALWGTEPAYTAPVEADFDSNGTIAFGEALPDANVLKGSVDTLAAKASELRSAAQGWQPTEAEAFTALVVMVPTMNEYFDSWKNSRFVAGDASQQRDFVAISRLDDVQNILGGLQVIHEGVSPRIQQVDPEQDAQIARELESLRSFVVDIRQQENAGERFSPEEADTLGAEAQNRATAITGQISQAAGELGVSLSE